MIYLYWYLGIGAVFLVIIFVSHQLTKSPADDQLNELLLAADPRKNRRWWKPLNYAVVPLLAAAMALTVWPIAAYWKVKEMIHARSPNNEDPPKEFVVTDDHLQKPHAIADIEAAEKVEDPLGAVPRLPFGHLNPAWETFKKTIHEGDQLWSFSAQWTTEWGNTETRDGYVVLSGGAIRQYFLTRCVFIDKDSERGEN